MADLLTHVLVPFIAMTMLEWRLEWVETRWIPVAMGGAAIPDLAKVRLVIDESTISTLLDLPFSWGPIESLAGVLAISGAVAIWFESERRQVYGWLVFGGLSSLLLDGLRAFADGQSTFWLYPLWWRPPTPNLYVSSDYRVTALVLFLAIGVITADRYVVNRLD